MFNDYTEADLPKNMLEGLGANHLTSMISPGLVISLPFSETTARVQLSNTILVPVAGSLVREFVKDTYALLFSVKGTYSILGVASIARSEFEGFRKTIDQVFECRTIEITTITKFKFEGNEKEHEQKSVIEIPIKELSIQAFKINFRDPYTTPDDYEIDEERGIQLGLYEFTDPRDNKVPPKN